MSEDDVKYLNSRIESLEGILQQVLTHYGSMIEFKGYGVLGKQFFLRPDSVMKIHQIDYNGNYGTEIKCFDGSIHQTSEWLQDVERKLRGPAHG